MRFRFEPMIDGLEGRQLMTRLPAPLPVSVSIPTPNVTAPTTSVPPFATGVGTPLPAEIAREKYAASFAGPFNVGQPLFTGESSRINIRGVGFGTQFLHGNIQMTIILPANPSTPIYGGAFVQDKNQASSNQVGLDIVFDPNSLDARGRPTLGAWSVDPNVYSGINFYAKGTGSVLIRYIKNNAFVVFKGSIYTNGISNPLGNTDIQP